MANFPLYLSKTIYRPGDSITLNWTKPSDVPSNHALNITRMNRTADPNEYYENTLYYDSNGAQGNLSSFVDDFSKVPTWFHERCTYFYYTMNYGMDYNSYLPNVTYYRTACTPPSKVRLNDGTSDVYSSNSAVLSWQPGSGGTEINAFRNYTPVEQIYDANGNLVSDWLPLRDINGEYYPYVTPRTYITVYAPTNIGYYKKFRVRTEDTGGVDYYSNYVETPAKLYRV